MGFLGNIIWFVLVGLWMALAYSIIGLLFCVTIIGIPFGTQLFKIARLYAWPFGTNVRINFDAHPIMNILWLIVFGWEGAVAMFVVGLVLHITIIGIPFGKQCFKLAKLSLLPFGAKI